MMGVWRNGSASDFDCRSLSEGCSFEYCHAHSFCKVLLSLHACKPFPAVQKATIPQGYVI